MTTATPSYFSAYDPSGAELRRELLLSVATTSHALGSYRVPLAVGALQGLALVVGVLRVALG